MLMPSMPVILPPQQLEILMVREGLDSLLFFVPVTNSQIELLLSYLMASSIQWPIETR
jgi:hypothetical protein